MNNLESLGLWVRFKYRLRAQEVGYLVVAKQLRKQGYPLEMALNILLGK